MGNCHKNRICEFLNNHCPQLLLNCFQSIFIRNSNEDEEEEKEKGGERGSRKEKEVELRRREEFRGRGGGRAEKELEEEYRNNRQGDSNYHHHHHHQHHEVYHFPKALKQQQQKQNQEQEKIENFLLLRQRLSSETPPPSTPPPQISSKELPLSKRRQQQQRITTTTTTATSSVSTTKRSDLIRNDSLSQSNPSLISSSSNYRTNTINTTTGIGRRHILYQNHSYHHHHHHHHHHQRQESTQSVHYCQHLSHCQYNTTGASLSSIQVPHSPTASLTSNSTVPNTHNISQNKLRLDLQQRLEMMHRQRSASHCPHTAINGNNTNKSSMHKCCCIKTQSSNLHNSQNNSRSSIVDPLVKMVVSPTSTIGGGVGSGNRKRASSLRVLNKRFNFFDSSPCSPNGNDNNNSNSGSRRGSRKHKRQSTKINDLDDECFVAIFEYLTLQEKLYYERVCRRWQKLIRQSLLKPASLKIGEHSVKCNCQCAHYPSWDLPPSKRFSRDQSGYIIYPRSVIKYLLTLCSELRCINFSHCYLDDQTLQIIMNHSDNIECLHLNDIRLEEDIDDLPYGLNESKSKTSDTISNGHQEESLSSAVGAIGEQLAAFGGFMRKLSTRRSLKKTSGNGPDKRHSDVSVLSKKSTNSCSSSHLNREITSTSDRIKTPVSQTNSSPQSSKAIASRRSEMSPLLPSSINRTTPNLAMPTTTIGANVNHTHDDMRKSLENIVRRTSRNLNNPQQQQQQPQPQPQQQTPKTPSPSSMAHQTTKQCNSSPLSSAATQRRLEWSMRHRSQAPTTSNRSIDEQQLAINVINETQNMSGSELTLNDSSSIATSSLAINNNRRHLSPNVAPNISSLQTDSDGTPGMRRAAYSFSGGSSSSNNTQNQIAESEFNSSGQYQQPISPSQPYQPVIDSIDPQIDHLAKMDHVQAYVEQEQLRHELRQSHLLQWKLFAQKLGSKIRCLSLGSLSSVDSIVIDILLKYSIYLEELRINNEIDILSYLALIKLTIKRIYINCEHGIGLECISLLAFRNYAEKVISLGRVDVPPDLIDSVISTIGSNFCNLRSLHLRLHNFDIDVTTPASLLFDNLNELNLQFVSGNVDQPFKKFIQLGWSSVRSLTIQYASITEESVRAIHEHMPQLRKLVLYAIEFRCDHLARRYGHRICTNCSHTVWKSIATLPHLNHLKLHRVIIDEEICHSLSRMYRLCNLELQYCSNVNDNVINVCCELAKRNPRRRFQLSIISRGFISFKTPIDCNNLFIDIKVACK